MAKHEHGGRPFVEIDSNVTKGFTPDIITLDIKFSDELATKEECIEQYNMDLKTALCVLEKCGIDKDQIKQSAFRIYPHKEFAYKKIDDEDGYYRAKEYIDGYEYSAESSVKLSADSDAFGNTWLALLEAEGQFTYSYEYGLEDEAFAEEQLLSYAVKEARNRAVILAEAAGSKLGNILSIEHGYRYSSYMCDELSYMSTPGSYDGFGSDSRIPDFNPEDIEIDCRVTASWELLTR